MSYYREVMARINTLKGAAAALDVSLPEKLTKAIAKAGEHYATDANIDPAALPDAVTAAAAAGRDPFTDPTVIAELLRRAHGNQVHQLVQHAHAIELGRLLDEHKPTILEAWRPRITELGKDISAASAALPGVSLLRRTDVGAAGTNPRHLALWAAAHAAVTALNAVDGIILRWISEPDPYTAALVGAELTAAQFDSLDPEHRRGTFWAGALLGVPLDVADHATYVERRARVESQRRTAEAEAQPRRVNLLTGELI